MNLFAPTRVVLTAGLAAFALSVLPSPAAAATNGIAVGVFPEFPTRIDQGAANVPASINLINGSSGAEAAGPLTVSELTLVPSCGNFSPTCAGGADPGLFRLSSTGTGAAGTNCAGRVFTISVVDSSTGRVRFARSDGAALQLAGTDMANDLDTCRIHFSISNLKLPTVDSYPTLGEAQTNQVGYMSVWHANGSTATDQGEDVTTVVPGTPTTTAPPTPTTTAPPAPTTTAPPAPTTTAPPAPTTTAPPAPTTTTTAPPAPAPTTTTTVRPAPTTTTTTVPAPAPVYRNPWWWAWLFGG